VEHDATGVLFYPHLGQEVPHDGLPFLGIAAGQNVAYVTDTGDEALDDGLAVIRVRAPGTCRVQLGAEASVFMLKRDEGAANAWDLLGASAATRRSIFTDVACSCAASVSATSLLPWASSA
jgi:hypothetical protein